MGKLFDNPTILVILIVAVIVIFGSKRLPDAARGVGRSLRILKAETKGLMTDEEGNTTQPVQPAPTVQQVPVAPAPQNIQAPAPAPAPVAQQPVAQPVQQPVAPPQTEQPVPPPPAPAPEQPQG